MEIIFNMPVSTAAQSAANHHLLHHHPHHHTHSLGYHAKSWRLSFSIFQPCSVFPRHFLKFFLLLVNSNGTVLSSSVFPKHLVHLRNASQSQAYFGGSISSCQTVLHSEAHYPWTYQIGVWSQTKEVKRIAQQQRPKKTIWIFIRLLLWWN